MALFFERHGQKRFFAFDGVAEFIIGFATNPGLRFVNLKLQLTAEVYNYIISAAIPANTAETTAMPTVPIIHFLHLS